MSDIAIVFAVIVVALALFIWNKLPAVIVGIGVSLALFFTGILGVNEAMAGFGDQTVILIAGLFVVSSGLEAAGVTAWAGQQLVKKSAGSQTWAFIFICLLAALATATVSVNGAVASLLPVVIAVALRLNVPTSQLMLPLCFATHSASMLTLLGAPLNVIAANMARDAGYGGIGFFEFAVAGIPMFIGSVVIMMLTQRFLLPHRNGELLPADLSAHALTLVEQYKLDDGLYRLRVRPSCPYVGKSRSDIDLKDYPGLLIVAVQEGADGKSLQRDIIEENDVFSVRGDKELAGRFAADKHLAFCMEPSAGISESLFNKGSGLAEVAIPPRSKLIGQNAFPGMVAGKGDLLVLAIQRGGENLPAEPTPLVVGDHLLLQGTWQALDRHLADPQVLVVDSPEVVRRQAVPLGHRAWEAIAILVLLIVLLATGWVPGSVAAVSCAVAMVLLGVLTIPQAYKGIDWSACILIGGMIPLATAMSKTGGAQLIADTLIDLVGDAGPRAMAAGLFLMAFALTQVISNTASALLMLPLAVATGTEMGISAMPLIISTIMGAHGALLTPTSTPVNLMVFGPGGYKFGDYWKFGLPISIWWLLVALFVVPLYWHF